MNIIIKTEQDLNKLPLSLSDKIEEWRQAINAAKKDLESKDSGEWCPEKYATISFYFQERKYILYPDALNIDDTLFYYIRNYIIKSLETSGMSDIKYMGMVD